MKLKVLAVAAVALLSASLVLAQPGKGGGPRGGGMRGMMMGIDQQWAALCFQINISPEQVAKLRPTFQWAWQQHQAAMQKAMASHSFEAAAKTITSVQSTVDSRVKMVLSKSQQAQWAKYKSNLEAQRAKMRSQMGGMGRGGQRK